MGFETPEGPVSDFTPRVDDPEKAHAMAKSSDVLHTVAEMKKAEGRVGTAQAYEEAADNDEKRQAFKYDEGKRAEAMTDLELATALGISYDDREEAETAVAADHTGHDLQIASWRSSITNNALSLEKTRREIAGTWNPM
jgi:hypothetical protein